MEANAERLASVLDQYSLYHKMYFTPDFALYNLFPVQISYFPLAKSIDKHM